MAFGSNLKTWRKENGFQTAKEFFDWLGGADALGVSLRRYQQVETDQFSPPKRLLLILLKKTPRPLWRKFVLDYVEASFREEEFKDLLLEYMEQSLLVDFELPSDNLWLSEEKRKLYSQEQMRYLIENKSALRFMKLLLLNEEVSLDEHSLSEEKIQRLVDLDLIRISGGKAFPSEFLYRIPIHGKAPAADVAMGTAFIKAHLDAFASMEGSNTQELVYCTQYVPEASAKLVRSRLLGVYKWVKSLSQKRRSPNSKAVIFIGFTKELEDHEF